MSRPTTRPVTGVFKLLRDEELWHTLAPLIEGAKAYSAESRRLAGEAEEGESGHDTSRG